MKGILTAGFMAAVAFGAGAANATISTVFDSQSGGIANFNATVASAGGTASTQTLTSGQSVYTDFVLSKTPSGGPGYTSGSEAIQGAVMGINPAGPNTFPRANPVAYQASGFTATFTGAVNAIGFEVGDWGTCCQPSALFISFDNGAPIQVGLSTGSNNVFLTNGQPIVFVGAFDDSDDFTTVSFWGDGVGEFLVAGGTFRYALLDQGSLPPTGGVPEPATWAMMIGGIGLAGGALRRRRTYGTVAAIA